jgi:hypothetical protein
MSTTCGGIVFESAQEIVIEKTAASKEDDNSDCNADLSAKRPKSSPAITRSTMVDYDDGWT